MKKNKVLIYIILALNLVMCSKSANNKDLSVRVYISGKDSLVSISSSFYPDLLHSECNETNFEGFELKHFNSKPGATPSYVLSWQIMEDMLSWEEMASVFLYSKYGASISIRASSDVQIRIYEKFKDDFEEAIFSSKFCSLPDQYGPYVVRMIPRSAINENPDTKNYYSNSRKYSIGINVNKKNMILYFTDSQLEEILQVLGKTTIKRKIKEALDTEPSFSVLWGLKEANVIRSDEKTPTKSIIEHYVDSRDGNKYSIIPKVINLKNVY